MGQMDGQVVLVTGAARGQGRSHAVRFAEEGADVIALDICEEVEFVRYPLGTAEELAETVEMVEKLGRRCLSYKVDARDGRRLREVVKEAVGELGRLDTVLINHGIARPHELEDEDTDDVFALLVAINLSSVHTTAAGVVPYMKENGGSIQITGSAASLVPIYNNAGYTAAKHALVGLAKCLAADLSPFWIRVNLVCPTNVATPLILNETNLKRFVPGVENPTYDDMEYTLSSLNQLPGVAWIEPRVVSDTMLFLSAETGKYVTGAVIPVDAGMTSQPPGITHFTGRRMAELAQQAGTTVVPPRN
jgi:SDR family mycofactocin-dependent oxidoreductase